MIRIRPATPDDAASVLAIYAPHVTHGTASFEETVPSVHEMRGRIETRIGRYPWLVAEDDGAVLGYAYGGQFHARAAYRWTVETTAYVAEAAQRRGVAGLLYEALLTQLRAQGFVQAVAKISLPNDASVKLHERAGFRRAGVYRQVGWKMGRWVDVGLWQAELSDPTGEPEEPLPYSDTPAA
jgi:phosphinothricin acetyltransferase